MTVRQLLMGIVFASMLSAALLTGLFLIGQLSEAFGFSSLRIPYDKCGNSTASLEATRSTTSESRQTDSPSADEAWPEWSE